MFDPSSRYAGVGDAQYEDADGRCYVYKRRRFPPLAPVVHGQLRVREGDRLDTITAQVLGDPLQFWRIADANLTMNPIDLVRPGAILALPVAGFMPRTRP